MTEALSVLSMKATRELCGASKRQGERGLAARIAQIHAAHRFGLGSAALGSAVLLGDGRARFGFEGLKGGLERCQRVLSKHLCTRVSRTVVAQIRQADAIRREHAG